MNIIKRKIKQELKELLVSLGFDSKLAALYSSRDISSVEDITYQLDKLIPPSLMFSISTSAAFLADHIDNNNKIIIIGDYDADGATATACGIL